MKAGILAAGLGERLREAGIRTPKPLLEVGGRPLLVRAVESAVAGGAEEIAIIVNEKFPEVARFVRSHAWPVPVRLTVRTTASSLESLLVLGRELRDAPFLLLTVDAITPPDLVAKLATAGMHAGPTGTLGVTTFVEDEKPLWADVDGHMEIRRLGAGAEGCGWVTSGSYFFFPDVFRFEHEARDRGLGSLRQFLGLVLERGGRLHAFPIGTSVDVDRPEDIRTAEAFLAGFSGNEEDG